MLRPRKMSRVLIAGPAGSLGRAVEALHLAGTLHITDYNEQYPGFKLGTPLPNASAISEQSLKLRSMSKVLGIDEGTAPQPTDGPAQKPRRMDELLAELGTTVAARHAEKQELETRLHESRRNIESIRPFTALPLPFEDYGAYESLAVYAGTVRVPIGAEVAAVTPRFELFHAPDWSFFALFVDIGSKPAVEKVLARSGYTEAKAPLSEGEPQQMLQKYLKVAAESEARMADLNAGLREARQKYLGDILACQEHLGVEVEKAEAPLRFAMSRSSFVIEGWIPSDAVDRTENSLLKGSGACIYMERMEEKDWLTEGEGGHAGGSGGPAHEQGVPSGVVDADEKAGGEPGEPHDPYENVPVALSNARPVKPFEMLTEMFSTPGYKEIDPTITMALVFPFFFGLMIGDLAYGILLATAGVFFMTRLKHYDGFRELGWYILIAGIIAAIFGAFVFGDAFGIPFHAPHGAEGAEAINWSGILGTEIPLRASVHKLEASGLGNLLMFSILAAVVHLSLGNIFGIVNEWAHNRKHAAAKAGWLLTVLGFGFLILKFGQATSLGHWLWDNVLWPFAPSWDPGIGILVPFASMIFLIAGVVMVVAGEGPIALTEVMGVFSNILSYTRLGAIGVAKGAMAFAFNILIIPMVTGGNIGFAVFGCVLLVLAHMLVFMLGSLSSGIQALRLNLVEYFMKFFKGGGVKFNPFGRQGKLETEESGA